MLLKNYIIDEIYLTYLYTFVLNIMSWSWTSYVDQPHAFFTCIYKSFRDTFSIASYIELKHSKTHAYWPSLFGQDG